MTVRSSYFSCPRWIALLAGGGLCARARSGGDVLPRDGGRFANDFFVCAGQVDHVAPCNPHAPLAGLNATCVSMKRAC